MRTETAENLTGSGPSHGADASSSPVALKMTSHQVVVVPGDGIGPEVMEACLRVLDAACPGLDWVYAEAGSTAFKKGIGSGLPQDTLDSIEQVGVALKGPLTTPIGYGEKSANVTLRKTFELFGNIRPVKELPGVPSPYAGRGLDFVIIRENVEDLYAGIEHMQTAEVAQCLKLVSRKGAEKIHRLAFAFAQAQCRSSVHCATKANIMKLTEGLFKSVFEEVAHDFDDIRADHMLIDNCAHQLVMSPEQFDIIVTTNMNGDIISDLAAGLVGGLGLAPSANVGTNTAVFEPVHGSAPDIAGANMANPTAMILSGVMMLQHLGFTEEADQVEWALRRVYEAGKNLTADVVGAEQGSSTTAFTDEIIKNLEGVSPMVAMPSNKPFRVPTIQSSPPSMAKRELDGVDVFVEWRGSAQDLAVLLNRAKGSATCELTMISNRGTMMYPVPGVRTDTVDHWRCRFISRAENREAEDWIVPLLQSLSSRVHWMHVEKLMSFDGTPGYTRAQGET